MNTKSFNRTALAAAAVLTVALLPRPAAADVPNAAPLPPGSTLLVSTPPDGDVFPGDTRDFTLASDGGTVAFLVDRDRGPYGADVYVRDLATGQVRQANTAADGTPADGYGESMDVSGDGSTVAFDSKATNLVPGDTNIAYQVYVKDLATGAVERASTYADGTPRPRGSQYPRLSNDGRIVAFQGTLKDNSGLALVRNRDTGIVLPVGTTDDGVEANAPTYLDAISGNGRLVLFQTRANNLDPADTTFDNDLYLKDIVTGDVRVVTGFEPLSVSGGTAFSADASTVALLAQPRRPPAGLRPRPGQRASDPAQHHRHGRARQRRERGDRPVR